MHKGGIADKVGNRFEARWLTHQLLGLLDGAIQSISIETLGDDDRGFEFSIKRANGTEWHQCKRQNAVGTWSIAALHNAGVLTSFNSKTMNEDTRCLFVSTDPAPQLKLLQDKIPATHSPEAFEASLSKAETQHWSNLKEQLSCDATGAFRLLARSECRTLSESYLTENLYARISYWFKGEPAAIASQFRSWVEDDHNFNREIRYDDVIEFARTRDIQVKQYELDRELPGRLRAATSNYIGSYPPIGNGLFKIDRLAVREVLDALQRGAKVVQIVGAAGMGKSAVITDVVEQLRKQGSLHLAFRVDQTSSVTTLEQLGSQIVGTSESPAVILAQLAGGRSTTLIIDQADAVSEVSGRGAEIRRVVLELVSKAALYPRVQLIFACRTFDIENDHAYRRIVDNVGTARVDIKPFEPSEIEPVLTRLGVLYDKANMRLMALLALPIGLTLAATLAASGINDLRRIDHLSELYTRLLELRDHEIQRNIRPGWGVYAPLTALATAMSEREELVASAAVLDTYAGASDVLQRASLIVVRGQRIGFIHESLFDFLHARAFVRERKPLIDFLLASEQTLFRRTQIRQILAFERELERANYLNDLRIILSDRRVRPHIRETIVRWLSTINDPTIVEWELVAQYAKRDGLPLKARNVIFGQRQWFDLLFARGILDGWLANEDSDLEWVLDFLSSVAPLAPFEVSKLVDSFLVSRPNRVRDVLRMFHFIRPTSDSRPLADCLIAALDLAAPDDLECFGSDREDLYGVWINAAPLDAARIFGAQLRLWFRMNREDHPFRDRYRGGTSMHWLTELAKAAPQAFLQQLLPLMTLAMERTLEGVEAPAEDSIWRWRHWDRTDVRSVDLLTVVRKALAEVGRDEPRVAMHLLRAAMPHAYVTSLHLLLETIPANPEGLRDLLVEQLDNPGLFKAGWHCADAHSAACAIGAALPWLSDGERERVEAAILTLRPEIDRARRCLALEAGAVSTSLPESETRRYVMYCLNQSGKREWSVLQRIGASQLSALAGERLVELDRKFRGQRPEIPDGIRGGWVRSPIAGERTKFMSDDAWLSAIEKFSKPSARLEGGGLTGGGRELSCVLKERAMETPERFLALLARFPKGTSRDFSWGITAGLSEAKPGCEIVERALEIAEANPSARPEDCTLIRMIEACVDPLGPRAEALLLAVATGEEDITGEISFGEIDPEPHWKCALTLGGKLHSKAINSARGSALLMLGDACWHSKDSFERHRPTIDSIVNAPLSAHVQFALSGLLMSALKHDAKQGVDWTLRIARSCPAALYSNNGQRILGWVNDLNPQAFAELINFYLNNGDLLARGFASLTVFQRCLHDVGWHSLAEHLMNTDPDCRSAAAAVASASFQSAHVPNVSTDWLIRLFSDDQAIVRQEAKDCFRRMETADIVTHTRLFEAYVASGYFEMDSTFFLHRLKHCPPELDEVVLSLLGKALNESTAEAGKPRPYALHEVGELVLKLYASNIDYPARRKNALDLIDRLVELGLMEMQKLEVL